MLRTAWCLLSSLALSSLVNANAQPSEVGLPRIIETKDGPVSGKKEPELLPTLTQFIGIPFAAPPVKELRFRNPQPVVPWTKTYHATTKKLRCAQLDLVRLTHIGSEGKRACDVSGRFGLSILVCAVVVVASTISTISSATYIQTANNDPNGHTPDRPSCFRIAMFSIFYFAHGTFQPSLVVVVVIVVSAAAAAAAPAAIPSHHKCGADAFA